MSNLMDGNWHVFKSRSSRDKPIEEALAAANLTGEDGKRWTRLQPYERLGLDFECRDCGERADLRDEDGDDFCNSCASGYGAPDAFWEKQ